MLQQRRISSKINYDALDFHFPDQESKGKKAQPAGQKKLLQATPESQPPPAPAAKSAQPPDRSGKSLPPVSNSTLTLSGLGDSNKVSSTPGEQSDAEEPLEEEPMEVVVETHDASGGGNQSDAEQDDYEDDLGRDDFVHDDDEDYGEDYY